MPSSLGIAQRAAGPSREFEEEAKIAMSRRLGDEGAGRIDPRADHDAFVDGALEPEHRTAQVADRREPPHQGRLRLPRRQQVEIGGLGGHQERHGALRP